MSYIVTADNKQRTKYLNHGAWDLVSHAATRFHSFGDAYTALVNAPPAKGRKTIWKQIVKTNHLKQAYKAWVRTTL